MSDEDDEVLAEFRIEAEELLAEAEEVLLKIEGHEDFESEFNKIFRSFHSLKGAAGMFEIDDLQSFMHIIEGQFESTREVGSMKQFQVDYFLMAIDSARKILLGQSPELDTDLFNQEDQPNESQPKEDESKKELSSQASTVRKEVQEKIDSTSEYKGLVYAVDDEELICDSLAEILRFHSYEVLTFTNPAHVLAQVQKRSPDLICTDLKMPQMSGLELLSQMRENKFEFPIVFITAFIDNDLLIEGMKAGASGFLEKPFEEHQVLGLATNSIERYKTWKLLNKSINYILYQFNDLDKYLDDQGKDTLRKSLRLELQELLTLRKSLMQSMGNR